MRDLCRCSHLRTNQEPRRRKMVERDRTRRLEFRHVRHRVIATGEARVERPEQVQVRGGKGTKYCVAHRGGFGNYRDVSVHVQYFWLVVNGGQFRLLFAVSAFIMWRVSSRKL
jgi:hypothetical protein